MLAHQDPSFRALEDCSFIGIVCRGWEVVVEALLTVYVPRLPADTYRRREKRPTEPLAQLV
jgi:hypothetical protein